MSRLTNYANRIPTTKNTEHSIKIEKPLEYEGPCHRCNKQGHKAINCWKPRVCGRCGINGHTDMNCGKKVMNSKEKTMKQKYLSICNRCGEKGGHASKFCPNMKRCKICTETHDTVECPRNGGSFFSKRRREKNEQMDFARQRALVVSSAEEEMVSANLTTAISNSNNIIENEQEDELKKKKIVKKIRVKRLVNNNKEEEVVVEVEEDRVAKRSKFEEAKETNTCLPLVDYASSSEE